MPNVVVVGAGPAGCAAALHLARKPNVHVQLLEKRTLQDLMSSADSSRAYPMMLSTRALNTLDALGLDLPSTSERYDGIMFLPTRNTMTLSDKTRLVSRTQLAHDLLRAAAQHGNISFLFGTSPTAVDLQAKRLSVSHQDSHLAATSDLLQTLLAPAALVEHLDLEPTAPHAHRLEPDPHHAAEQEFRLHSDGPDDRRVAAAAAAAAADDQAETRRAASSTMLATRLAAALAVRAAAYNAAQQQLPDVLEYDLLIAADGGRSQVRGLVEALGELQVRHILSKEGPESVRYQTFSDVLIPDGVDGARYPFAAADTIPRRNLFFIESKDRKCKLVFWRSDSDHLCGMLPASRCVLSTLDAAALKGIFGDDVPDWMAAQVAEQLRAQCHHHFGSIVKCSQLHANGGVVLLGDAAHAVTSKLGQGCNMALESVQVLSNVVEEQLALDSGLEKVPEAFSRARLPDVAAMQDLEHMMSCMVNDVSHEDGVSHLEETKFKVHSRIALGGAFLIGFLQWRLMPQVYTTIPMYDMLYDAKRPYSAVLTYVNQTASAVYTVLGFIVLAIGINTFEVVFEF